jgi:hypothetical protein
MQANQPVQTVFDPRGVVETTAAPLAPRVRKLEGMRLGILDNTKWNGNKLLRGVRDRLTAEIGFGAVNYYRKESFSKVAAPDIIADIVANNDVVMTAIGD